MYNPTTGEFICNSTAATPSDAYRQLRRTLRSFASASYGCREGALDRSGQTMSKRALIVDDNLALARVTQFALDRAGFETQTARNGRLALEAATSDRSSTWSSPTSKCRK